MLRFPGKLSATAFLARYWQKQPLFMPEAIPALQPSMSRNELAWLATLDDVESRIVFTDRSGPRTTYRAETGPFDPAYLGALAKRDWTLLVHDVEKHLPAMRRLFDLVPFIPDWRIDDLMISFAAPGGSVGPHCDNYDVFLCQGIGIREWQVTTAEVLAAPDASRDLALLAEFDGLEMHVARAGDVLYLPPGIAHWGVAKRACMTYSIGMRAPRAADLHGAFTGDAGAFYTDPDLAPDEALPGYIGRAARARARRLLGELAPDDDARLGAMLGCAVTQSKAWLRPEPPDAEEIASLMASGDTLRGLRLHAMARLAYDDDNVYLDGRSLDLRPGDRAALATLCERRSAGAAPATPGGERLLPWLLANGAFDTPEIE